MPKKDLNSAKKKRQHVAQKRFRARHGMGSDTNLIMEERDYKEVLKEISRSPAVRYVAGGIAIALLTKVASNMAGRFPEISSFIRENVHNLEDRWENLGNSFATEIETH